MDDPRGQDAGRFDTTQWSAVFRAQSAQSTAGRKALADLVQRYYPALRVHLLRKRWLDEHRVNDLLQGFVTDKLLEKRLIDRADPEKGKFRALLVRALENYVIDQLRGDPPPAAELKTDPPVGAETTPFDVAWARSLLTDTLDRMKRECSGKQRVPIWEVFDCRLLQPTRLGVEPTPYDELVRRFGFESPDQASNALVTAKRTFNRVFAQVAADYLADDEQPEDLVAELLTTLHRAGPLEWQGAEETALATEVSEAHLELDDTSPRLLAVMIDSPPDADSLWTSADLGDYLRHLLAQPIGVALGYSEGDMPPVLQGDRALTLAELFEDLQPPEDLLLLVKKFGRRQIRQTNALLPREVASVVYFASLAAAQTRLARRITSSSDEVLAWGYSRALELPWLAPSIRTLLEAAGGQLTTSGAVLD